MRHATPQKYIQRLLSSRAHEIGVKLQKLHERWMKTLKLNHFLEYLDEIQANSRIIQEALGGLPQMIGQFRSYSLEQFIILNLSKITPDSMRICWNEDIPIWHSGYSMKFDVYITPKEKLKPIVAVEAKIDVDAPRLKAAILNFLLLKKIYPYCKCLLVYVNWNASQQLMEISQIALDGIYEFSWRKNMLENFLSNVNKDIQANRLLSHPPHPQP